MNIVEELLRIRWAFNKIKAEINAIDKDIYRSRKFEKQIIEKLDYLENEIEMIKNNVSYNQKSILENKKEIITNKVDLSKLKDSDIVPVSSNQIVGNKRTGKVHYGFCPYAKKVRKQNYIGFRTVQDSLDQGYNRCSCILNN